MTEVPEFSSYIPSVYLVMESFNGGQDLIVNEDGDSSDDASPAEKKSKTSNTQQQGLEISDEDYLKKRQRNNLAVKKSRERSKQRIQETQERVEQLTQENQELQTKVTLLSKELNVLRALFTNGGFTVPCNLQIVATANTITSTTTPTSSIADRETNSNSIPKVTLELDQLRQQAVPLPANCTSRPTMIPMPQMARNSPPPLEFVANGTTGSHEHRASVIRNRSSVSSPGDSPSGQNRKLIFITEKGQLMVKPEPK